MHGRKEFTDEPKYPLGTARLVLPNSWCGSQAHSTYECTAVPVKIVFLLRIGGDDFVVMAVKLTRIQSPWKKIPGIPGHVKASRKEQPGI